MPITGTIYKGRGMTVRNEVSVGWGGIGCEEEENSTVDLFREVWQLKELAVGFFNFFKIERNLAQELCRGSKDQIQEGRGKPWMRRGTHSLSLNTGTRIVWRYWKFMGAGGGGAVPCFSVEQVVKPLAESEGNVALKTRPRSCSHHGKWEIRNRKRDYWAVAPRNVL